MRVPSYQTRLAIVRREANAEAFPIDDHAAHLLAHSPSNVWELEGTLRSFIARVRLLGSAQHRHSQRPRTRR